MSRSRKRFVFFRIYLSVLFLHMCMFPAYYFRQRTHMAQDLYKFKLSGESKGG